MITCPLCTTHVPDTSRFCLACGTLLAGSTSSTLVRGHGRPAVSGAPPSPRPGLPDHELVPGSVLAGRFRLVALLGKGGMGEVYRADDLKLGESVALKLLPAALSRDSELLGRLHHEVRIARKIAHPNVCRVFDIGEVSDHPFLSMELVDGENLASLLRRIGRLPPDKVVDVARQLCAGLGAAHERGVLHRDLKPANVMIDGLGRVRITDFGLAGFEGELGSREARSGTPAYMAPEQLAGGRVSVRSDLFSLGLVLYEMLTGQRPFTAKNPAELARQQKEDSRAPPSSVVPGIDPLTEQAILRCLAYEPVDRPASAREVAAALPGAAALARACPECGLLAHPGFRFCGRCGTVLAEGSEAAPAAARPVAESDSSSHKSVDRRQVTALFCDLAGSTALAEELEPEELSEILWTYLKAAGEVVERFGGHVAQHLGDGLRAYFGYPRAHEDDARRALYAGLGILEAIDELNRQVYRDRGVRLGVRVSAHTGHVVAGEIVTASGREHVATGATLNVAALLLEHARPGTLVMSGSTLRLVEGFFVCESLGPLPLKGVSRPVEAYRLDGEADGVNRVDLAVAGDLTPMVGRELELALLRRCRDRVRQGRGQAVLIVGEPGIGKSRLVHQTRELLAGSTDRWWFCRSSPYYSNSAFHPLIELLCRVLQFQRDESSESRLGKLEGRLRLLGFDLAQAVPVFASLLSLSAGGYEIPEASPQERLEETLDLLLTLLLRWAEGEPAVLVVEDLHWIDPSSLSLLGSLMSQVATSRLLVLMTARPAFQSPWGSHPHLTHINLDRLSDEEVRVMIDHLTGGKSLPGEVVSELTAKTDGIPLAVEEMVRMVLDSDLLEKGEHAYELAGPWPPLAIPATLQDSLEARLDRMGPYRELAQLASVLGREFSYELLRGVSPLPRTRLRESLGRLVDAEILLQRGLPPKATYIFRHALIQDAAYRSLLLSERRAFHSRIADLLVEGFPEIAATQPEYVAHHYTEAGRDQPAADYWLAAGRLAAERFGNHEAIGHLEKGLGLLATLPATEERDRQELQMRLALGPPLMETRGFVDPGVERTYVRARELCRQLGDASQLPPVLWGLWQFYLSHARLEAAREMGDQLLALVRSTDNNHLLPLAHSMLGEALFFLGELELAREHFESGIESYDPAEHRSFSFRYGHDPGVACLCFGGWTLWPLGEADRALELAERAVALAEEVPSPFSLAEALVTVTNLHQLRGEAEAAQQRAEAALALSREKKFRFWIPIAVFLRGWAVARQGGLGEGIAQMREGLAGYRAGAADHVLPWFLSILAETLAEAEQVGEGLTLLSEALAIVARTGERWWEAELHRLRGELLLAAGDADSEAEDCFERALTVARAQHARTLEERALLSSTRLSERLGRALVADSVDRF